MPLIVVGSVWPLPQAKLEKFAYWHPDVVFTVLDVNKMPQEIIKKVNVTQMPTLQVYRDGEMVSEIIGAEDGDKVISQLRSVLEELMENKAR